MVHKKDADADLTARRLRHLEEASQILASASPEISAHLGHQKRLLEDRLSLKATESRVGASEPPVLPSCPRCGTIHLLGHNLAFVEPREHPRGLRGTRCAACHLFTALPAKPGRHGPSRRSLTESEHKGRSGDSQLSSLQNPVLERAKNLKETHGPHATQSLAGQRDPRVGGGKRGSEGVNLASGLPTRLVDKTSRGGKEAELALDYEATDRAVKTGSPQPSAREQAKPGIRRGELGFDLMDFMKRA